MTHAGIEAINVYGGIATIDVMDICKNRNLDIPRFENLMMKEKTMALPYEDPISFAVNAAKPIVDALSEDERGRIEMVITCSESGIDFGKSMSTYVHDLLGLQRNCRLFEIKQACYSGTAGLQTALSFVLSGQRPGAKALVIATDISRFALADPGEIEEWAYSEPSSGAGAVALLVSDQPRVLSIDIGANGYYGFEVMDTCRPGPENEAGDADLSLMAYLDCMLNCVKQYCDIVEDADYRTSFNYLALHTPFGGMVKGAHRHVMRRLYRSKPADIESDFQTRVGPSLEYGQRVGNTAGASLFLALASTIDCGDFTQAKRIGLFSYGSGCCSEFYSGVVGPEGKARLAEMGISAQLDQRYALDWREYEVLLSGGDVVRMGTKDTQLNHQLIPQLWDQIQGRKVLVLDKIENYHRVYKWV